MRFDIDRGVLAEVLGGVVSCLPAKTTYAILQNVLLGVEDGKLTLSGTDLEVFVTKQLPLEGQSESGRVVLPGRKFLDIVREIRDARVTVVGTDQRVKVEAGSIKTAFNAIDPAEYPEMAPVPEGVRTEFPLATLLAMHDAVGFAASKDEGRPEMCGLSWEVGKAETRLVATDGHRLGLSTHKGKFLGRIKAIITPKVFGLFPRGESVAIVTSDPAKVGFVFQSTTVVARIIDGKYPDFERVIPKSSPGHAVLDRDELTAALRRAAVFAHPIGRAVALSFSKSRLAIHAEAPDVGSSDEDMTCEYGGDPLRIGFNAAYMLEVLKHLTPGKLTMELSSPLAAVLVRSATPTPDVDDAYLLMPIRLD
jgi:DNA polymerase-3 subunit beta